MIGNEATRPSALDYYLSRLHPNARVEYVCDSCFGRIASECACERACEQAGCDHSNRADA